MINLRAFLLALLLTTGCASKPPEHQDYLLRPPVGVPIESPPQIVLGRIEVAAYLDQRGIVIESAPGEVSVARHHRWAEPLSASLRRYLQVATSRAAGRPVGAGFTQVNDADTRINVLVHQLHATLGGEVRLRAEWQLVDVKTGTVRTQRAFATTEALTEDGYGAVVASHRAALDALGADIGAGLLALEGDSRPVTIPSAGDGARRR